MATNLALDDRLLDEALVWFFTPGFCFDFWVVVGLYVGLGSCCLRGVAVQGNALNFPPRCAGEAVPALQNILIVAVLRLDSGDFEGATASATGDVLVVGSGWGVH